MISLLSVDPPKSRFVIVFPGFRMGFKRDAYEQAMAENWLNVPKGTYHYRGKTAAMTAFSATKGILAMLSKIFEIDDLQKRVVLATDEQTELLLQEPVYSHYVMLGTRSQGYSRQLLQQYSRDFEFSYMDDAWSIIDKRESKSYTVPDPSKTVPGKPIEGTDYALLEKIIDTANQRVIIIIAGMWDTGTLAAGNFLVSHRHEIYKRFGSGEFQYLLELPAGSTEVRRVIVERRPQPI